MCALVECLNRDANALLKLPLSHCSKAALDFNILDAANYSVVGVIIASIGLTKRILPH